MRARAPIVLILALSALPTTAPAQDATSELDRRIEAIHRGAVFADMHAHPSRFHRANVERIEAEEVERYRRGLMDVVVANISTDAAYSGGYVTREGVRVPREGLNPAPGEPFAFTLDRLERVLRTIREDPNAVLAESPAAVRDARERGQVAILPALEGADGLEGRIENLRELHRRGVRLVQLVHFRVNELGHIQTDTAAGGLTPFGREVVREANRLGIVIDLAHANTATIRDVLELSADPVIFSHTGAKALYDGARYLTDEEMRMFAAKGGVVGIWPNGESAKTVAAMADNIEHVVRVAGVDHVGIGSDLRGMGSYSEGFGEEANFRAIAAELLRRGWSDADVGKVMGGNFWRVWTAAAEGV